MADPPVYELVDSNGNVVGEFKQVSGETVIDNQENDTVRIPSLSTEVVGINGTFLTASDTTSLVSKLGPAREIRLTSTANYSIDELNHGSLRLIGLGGFRGNASDSTQLSPDSSTEITINEPVEIESVLFFGESTTDVTVSSLNCAITRCSLGNFTVSDDQVSFLNNRTPTITFESGTEGGIAVGNVSATITDNGNNEVIGNS